MIVDVRCRLTTSSSAAYFRERNWANQTPALSGGDIEDFFKELDEAGVTTAVSVSGHNRGMLLGDNVFPDRTTSNDEQAQVQKDYPGRFVAVAGIDPSNDMHNGLEEMERCVKQLGIHCAFIEPGRAPWYVPHLADRRLYPFYSLAQELGVVIIPQTSGDWGGLNIDYAHPRYIDQIAEDFPDLTIICGHGCNPYIRELIVVAGMRRENVYASPDSKLFQFGADDWLQGVNSGGGIADKFLFGSAYPLGGSLVKFVDRYKALPWAEEVRDRIFWRNALRALKLEDDPVYRKMYNLNSGRSRTRRRTQ